jgi:hypothetical protein
MAYYAKANRKAYERFNFSVGERYQLKDANYLLWQADLVKLGTELNIQIGTDFEAYIREVAEQIGALVLTPQEAKSEQDGASCRELPTAKDPRFIVETAAKEEEDTAEPNGEETPSEETEETSNEQSEEVEDEHNVSE